MLERSVTIYSNPSIGVMVSGLSLQRRSDGSIFWEHHNDSDALPITSAIERLFG